MNDDIQIYTFQQAVSNAIEMSIKYNKDFAVVKILRGYSIIGAKYAKRNIDKLDIEYITNINN